MYIRITLITFKKYGFLSLYFIRLFMCKVMEKVGTSMQMDPAPVNFYLI